MLEASKRNRGTIIALSLFAAGVAGTVLDPNGPIGIALFGVAAAAAVYLSARPFRNAVRRLVAARPKSMPRRTMVNVVRGRTVAVVAAATALLFAVWLTVDVSRPLMYATWWGFCVLAAWLIGVGVLTARRSLRATA
ncbi:MAG TPA: hypothetical protein VNB91_15525 [Jatrophihabitantaceae bacterium]|jgi:hypothetical protein|nr:hypothetical protein [Jatrophihabitantaceae bacterium]